MRMALHCIKENKISESKALARKTTLQLYMYYNHKEVILRSIWNLFQLCKMDTNT